MLEYFNQEEVAEGLEYDGFYIHYHTSDAARREANYICDILGEENSKIYTNIEAPPACNVAAIIDTNIRISNANLYGILDEDDLKKELLRIKKL